MKHWKKNPLVVFDTETTGLVPGYHEVIEIGAVVLNSEIEPDPDAPRFNILIYPEHKERATEEAMKINGITEHELNVRGVSKQEARIMFDRWASSLTPGGKWKGLLPLAQNWPFDRGFLSNFLTPEVFGKLFYYEYRDTKSVVAFLNDRAVLRGEVAPFPKTNLNYLCEKFEIENKKAHRAVSDAIACAAVYKKLTQML